MSPQQDSGLYAFVPGAAPVPTVVGGHGAYLHLADGRKILDGAGGAIVTNIGHGRHEPADAVAEAMRKVDYTVPLWATTNRLLLQETLRRDWLPEGFDHIFFTSGGSESTDSALRLVRAYQMAKGRPERHKVIGRHPSYHGVTIGTTSVASHTGRRAGYEPMLLDWPKVPWDDAEAVVKVIEREDPATIAGFFVEPITGAAGGCLVASDDYWRTVTAICKEYDIVLVADEVMTGYGRTGKVWGHQNFPIEPDVIVGGKGLGGGYVPIGMVAAHNRIADALSGTGPWMFFTFSGSDAMCAGANVVLNIMTQERLVERVAEMGPVLEKKLRDAVGHHPNVIEIRGKGLFWGIEFCERRDPVTLFPTSKKFAAAVSAEALSRGAWIYPAGSGPVHDAIMLGPSFTITEAEMDELVGIIKDSIEAVVARG
jgi:adenosylmethionine-8-amino-7-oxononanoate aminotransferase